MDRTIGHRLIILTVVWACGITSTLSMAASLTPYANDFGAKGSKAAAPRCLEQTPGAKALHAQPSEPCVERLAVGGEAPHQGSVTALLRHLGIYEALSDVTCSTRLDCGVKSSAGLGPPLQEGSLPVTLDTVSFRDDQTRALWSAVGGMAVSELNGGDNFKPLSRDDSRFVPVSAPVIAQAPASAPTLWERILHFGPFLLLFLERLKGRV